MTWRRFAAVLLLALTEGGASLLAQRASLRLAPAFSAGI